MALSDTITIPKDQWFQLTADDATTATWFVKRGTVHLVPTAGAVPPADFKKAIPYETGQGEADMALAKLAPGTAGITRMYGYSNADSADIYFSHD